ncbi:MAG: hypothetical protein ACXWLH_01550 [Candidatus Saccharimonadales bacterium]
MMKFKPVVAGITIAVAGVSAGYYVGGELHDAFSDHPASEQAADINRCANAIGSLAVAPIALEAC